MHLDAPQEEVREILDALVDLGDELVVDPELVPDLPVEMYLWVLASTLGFTRTATGATTPSSPATVLMNSSSATDSTLKQ